MAGIAFAIGNNVLAVFASGIAAIVAGGADRSNAVVVKACHLPVNGVVAAGTLRIAHHMVSGFTGLLHAVMALLAVAQSIVVFKTANELPAAVAMALAAGLAAVDVANRFAATRDIRAATMAKRTLAGCAFKAPLHVANLAFHKAVKALQRKAGGIMIKIGPR